MGLNSAFHQREYLKKEIPGKELESGHLVISRSVIALPNLNLLEKQSEQQKYIA